MNLSVLSVAFPFAPVSPDPVGGAEQVLAMLDRAIVRAGGTSTVIACEGSHVAGRLIPMPTPRGEIDETARASAHARLRATLAQAIADARPDVVHLHGVDFDRYLPRPGVPVLVTLHMPLAWYAHDALATARAGTWLAPVSHDQAQRRPAVARLVRPIENGVDVQAYLPRRKQGYVVALGRICHEKGFHLALDAAKAAAVPLLLAGSVFPYAEHRRYFEAEIRPRLDRRRRWLGPVTGAAKRRLLAGARCVVAPSLAPETSSLVAREAAAAGTPVVALRNGALAEAVEDGRTGILVDEPEALAQALLAAGGLSPAACRQAAEDRFAASRMTGAYLDAYRALACGEALPLLEAAA